MKFLGIIPARYESSRFPGKSLADLGGKPLIVRVYNQVKKVLDNVIVATDDQRIEAAVKDAGGQALMTGHEHKSGTDRCAEAARLYCKSGNLVDVIINVQGDEPFIREEQIKMLMKCFDDQHVDIATLVNPIRSNDDIFNSNIVKVIKNHEDIAMYFSRSPIPYLRKTDRSAWSRHHQFLRHIGVYAFRYRILQEITELPQSSLELAESLEQNRWLENNYRIKIRLTDMETFSIDTPGDLKNAKKYLSELD
ncbi:MAG: 3-deoxy-manno-octulosonate cytidylyltransferase [Bacteroides sp. SM23_62_1]|nr:MAG: 3-deoxy-manno-octulosonate cytidylyltransferase [Bacteroides sp. SM23_62_1]